MTTLKSDFGSNKMLKTPEFPLIQVLLLEQFHSLTSHQKNQIDTSKWNSHRQAPDPYGSSSLPSAFKEPNITLSQQFENFHIVERRQNIQNH